jgi:hypothetical protein
LTNAYITHAKRVLKLLDIDRFFEGTPPPLSLLVELKNKESRIAIMDRVYWFVNLRMKCTRKQCLRLVLQINQNATLSMILTVPLLFLLFVQLYFGVDKADCK